MIIPIRCFTCNRILASKYKKYLELIATETDQENIISGDPHINLDEENVYQKAFKEIGIGDRYCCKRHMLCHVDLIHKI